MSATADMSCFIDLDSTSFGPFKTHMPHFSSGSSHGLSEGAPDGQSVFVAERFACPENETSVMLRDGWPRLGSNIGSSEPHCIASSSGAATLTPALDESSPSHACTLRRV